MSITVKRATISNILDMQHMNMMCLPENYTMKYYLYHLLTWPELSFVAYDEKFKIVGYVMGKLDDDDELPTNESCNNGNIITGHITSLAVKLSHRKLGIAKSLMDYVERQMSTIYYVTRVTLHVRVGNLGALHLYQNSLHFKVFYFFNFNYFRLKLLKQSIMVMERMLL